MAQETGSSMFGCFPAVFVAIVFGLLAFLGMRSAGSAAEAAAAPPVIEAQAQAGQSAEGTQSLTIVEKIETQVSTSVPATITLQVSGYHPDGCKFPVQVQQSRVGNTVTVKIFRIVPDGVLCTMELNPYSETVQIEGTFESGEYTIDVNGTVVTVKV